ncbi:MAG: biosynthetic peptidoglycan transglycosylase [Peptostreptococcaceae bacterium]
MKKSFKNIIMCIFAVMIIISIPASKELLDGYNKYKYVVTNIGIETKISGIKNNNNYTDIKDIDKDFLNAIVSIEDHRFYEHNGLDFIGIVRATMNNVKEGRIVQGGSTITQQLVKNIYLDGDRNYSRKVAEVFLVNEIENMYTKNEILELYANVINYGNGYIGIKDACNGYFDTVPSELNYEEAAMLAGLPQYPEGYNPKKYYEKAVARQQIVLEAIDKYGKKENTDEFYLMSIEYEMRSLKKGERFLRL